MALYSEKVMDHFKNPRNVGVIEDADGVGEVGNAKCGDIMKMYIKVKDGVLTDFAGGYTEYQEYKARQKSLDLDARHKQPRPAKVPREPRTADPAKRMARLESQIEKLEASLADVAAREQEHAADYQKLMELGQQRAALQEQLDELYERWEALAEQ